MMANEDGKSPYQYLNGEDSYENKLHCTACHNLQKAVKAVLRGKCVAFIGK